MVDVRVVAVPDGLAGERVDAAVARLFGISRAQAATIAGGGGVVLRGIPAPKSARVAPGDLLEVTLPGPQSAPAILPVPVPDLRIVHEDDDIVVVDKPPGVAAHPSVGWDGPDVLSGLAAANIAIATSGAPERQGIVSRLDVGTSGLMVLARSEGAYSALKHAFRSRQVDKTYHTVVQGLPDPLSGTIDAPIGRHPAHDYKFAVMGSGRHSVTHYELLEAFRSASLLEVTLETGRTHQIRVHFSALRHPCVGDLTYGADPTLASRLGLRRQWLHAVALGFEHPGTGRPVTFTSEYAADLRLALDLLGA
ncbi:MAG: RluA family pseudouridine synthase [Tetrasphaera sp.]|nr:RluA family pseudouridine synthase [Tetrasphaera sp.]